MTLSRVAVAGSTGYSGQVLLSLLERHKGFQVTELIARNTSIKGLKDSCDLVFLCTPAETSLEMAPKLLKMGLHVVDVSGAFRLKKYSYPEWYGFEHTEREWLDRAEYGLYPWKSLDTAIPGGHARLVANPGCFATAALMTLIPLLKSGLLEENSFVVDAKSGTTGAGRKPEVRLLFSELEGEFAPYKVGRHQHWPEIVESLSNFTGRRCEPLFVTELLPVARGISAAVFGAWTPAALKMKSPAERLEALERSFEEFYNGHHDLCFGTDIKWASMKSVVGTNRVHFCLNEAYGRPVVFCSLDNLVRGAAGQALMNANQLAGFAATEGLL